MLYLFFSILVKWGGWVLENSIFIFETFPKTRGGSKNKTKARDQKQLYHIMGFLKADMPLRVQGSFIASCLIALYYCIMNIMHRNTL